MRSITAFAPGRINIIGEHTDYNDGFVLPAAIDKKLVVRAFTNSTDSQVNVMAKDLGDSFSFDLKKFDPVKKGWPNYVMGVVHELQKTGAVLNGFDAEFESDIPIGSGLSSSAALECGFAVALNELFDLGLNKWQLAQAAQMAEHNFVGIKCGIMDQFASMMGQRGQVMLLDCRHLQHEYFPLDLGGYQLLLLNTNVSHSLASSEYNDRRAECEQGVGFLKKQLTGIINLRDVTLEQLAGYRGEMPELLFRRCHHVVSENERVMHATTALQHGDPHTLGQLMYQSHFSLQNDYGVSCPELDFLVQKTMNRDYILGSRMMGGGFGGCTINIIEKNRSAAFIEEIAAQYREQFGIDLTPIEVSIGDCASTFRP